MIYFVKSGPVYHANMNACIFFFFFLKKKFNTFDPMWLNDFFFYYSCFILYY
jgi:hypothetical protein